MEIREAVLLTRLREHLKQTLDDIDEIFGPAEDSNAVPDATLQQLQAYFMAQQRKAATAAMMHKQQYVQNLNPQQWQPPQHVPLQATAPPITAQMIATQEQFGAGLAYDPQTDQYFSKP